ncbi:MAG: universal stress protein [Reinekea sp.]|jgi:nucleotide-binding universal stress UspA family protein
MRPDISKILYASDISKGSRPAFRHAVKLAHQFDAELTYIHVLETLPSSSKDLTSRGYFSDTDLAKRESAALEFLDKAVRERIKNFFDTEMSGLSISVPVSFRIESGSVARSILSVADELGASMIVMGARKQSVVERLLLGSTSNKVLHHAKMPVLIVPLTDQDSEEY